MKKAFAILLFIFIFSALAACSGNTNEGNIGEAKAETTEPELFKIGVIPALTEKEYEIPMQRLEAVLDEALPQKVEITVYPDYNAVVEALNFDHIQMAFLGPATYVEANHRSGAQAIVTQLINGSPFYHSYLITQADASWNSLEDVVKDAGTISFAFGDQGSTSGSLIPSQVLKEHGVWQDENTSSFKEMRYTGSHDATGLAVQNKHVDVGAIDSAYYDKLIKDGVLDASKFKVLWKSEPLFQYPWAVSSKVDQDTIQLLQDTFVEIKDEEILNGFGASAFVIAKDEDYEPIRQVMQEMGRLE